MNAVTEAKATDMACCAEPGLRHREKDTVGTCLGTRCMAWRWADAALAPILPRLRKEMPYEKTYMFSVRHDEDIANVRALPRPADVPAAWDVEYEENTWVWYEDDAAYELRKAEHERTWPSRRTGYCGRAGNPDSEGRASFVLPSL